MAGELKIRAGTKLRMALDVPIGEQPKFKLICTFVKSLDVASFLISIPMVDGKPMPIDERRKLLIRYGADKDGMIVAGYADDVVKEGIRRCWKIRRVAEQRQFFQRADERLKVTIPITYSQPTWRPDDQGNICPEEAVRVAVWRNGERTVYAMPSEEGAPEYGCENFVDEKTVCRFTEENFLVGNVDKYTIAIWMEGDDPECVDGIVGGSVEFSMHIDADNDDETNLLWKFVKDVFDTLRNDKPISAAGTEAPDYYKSHDVNWYNRRNGGVIDEPAS